MAIVNPPKRSKKSKSKPKTCPTCGAVECFDRPRFFSGQLLTDKDLDTAQRYVIEKNKLHNRYLVGTGVVCGLAVRCDPCCDGCVIVEPGYAIDCCGNDIVVRDSIPFNILDYLKKEQEETYCDPRISNYSSRCDDEPKEYCLAIFYDEAHIKPVTALIRDNGCSTSRCEPSRTSETFRFELVEKPQQMNCRLNGIDDVFPNNPNNPTLQTNQLLVILKALIKLTPSQSFLCNALTCLFQDNELVELYKEYRRIQGNRENQNFKEQARSLFSKMCNYALKLYKKEPRVRCQLIVEINEIKDRYPFQDSEQYESRVRETLDKMAFLIVQLFVDCICEALLVPCAECDEEEGVLLACLTLKGNTIEKICNISRKQLTTSPALRYWMQPLFASVEKLAEQLCCDTDFATLGRRTS